ncbi:MAG: DUF3786 domain-containing protein [Oscillospiraceae bacterium]|nr:DUF3786 domain-containing protein [Oscillospiraceae bacterium]
MQVENHKEEVPFSYYCEKFQAAEPEEMALRSGAKWDGKAFTLTLLGTEYAISHPEYTLTPDNAPLPLQTFLLRFLLEGKKGAVSTDYKTFREMPWGELYIQPFTGRVLTRAAFTFGTRIDKFRKAAEALGGLPLSHGDAGYEFELTDNYRLRLLVWEGDDEFPPNAQLLYTDNFVTGFSAEDRVVAGDLLIGAVKSKM